MSSQPKLIAGTFRWILHGPEYQRIGIDLYRGLDGRTMVTFNISGQSRSIKMVTPTYMEFCDSQLAFLSMATDILIESYICNGENFGEAVTQTSNLLGLQEVPYSILLSMSQKEVQH